MPAIYTRANLAWQSVITACRNEAGLRQEELARLCGMNQQDISKIEKGRRPLRAGEIPLFAGIIYVTNPHPNPLKDGEN